MPLVSSMLSQPESSHPGDPGNSTPPPNIRKKILFLISHCSGGSSSCSLVKRQKQSTTKGKDEIK